MRVGTGYDVHKLVEGRKLILGGVTIDFEKGLLGHSDADVLLHAIMDALLGAAALGDIGKHFPDTDPKYEGASSMELMKEVKKMLDDKFYMIENVDATIIAQRPKLRPYIDEMRNNIATVLDIDLDRVNVKATTEENMGFTGEGKGISVQAVSLITSMFDYQVQVGNNPNGCAGCPGCAALKDKQDSDK
ncbi:MAG: 2-C-methyl-D-erythritol 2,4-cyclodiphosphate synthase [Lachnospiraceae bacterium]|nr:2-C-methyl-D-erythritol 2,4-cyclodiphosphate synthase [Lachnospiraceae bacterium]